MKPSVEIEIVETDEHVPYGIVMVPDWTAEHQRGITKLYEEFGMRADSGAFERFILPQRDENSAETGLFETLKTGVYSTFINEMGKRDITRRVSKSASVFVANRSSFYTPFTNRYPFFETIQKNGVFGYWSASNFLIGGVTPEARKLVESIHLAHRNSDLAAYMVGRSPAFPKGGLKIAVASLVPQQEKDFLADVNYENPLSKM